MARVTVVLALVVASLSACAPDATPTPTPAPAGQPSSAAPGGDRFVNVTRCNALRAEIQANIQAHAAEAAVGHTAEADQLRVKIAASLDQARAVPGCNVADLRIG